MDYKVIEAITGKDLANKVCLALNDGSGWELCGGVAIHINYGIVGESTYAQAMTNKKLAHVATPSDQSDLQSFLESIA